MLRQSIGIVLWTGFVMLSATAALAQTPAKPPAASAPDRPGVVYSERVRTMATVRAVDRDQRTIALQGPAGGTLILKVPPEAQNLDRVAVGDTVSVEYLESVALFVRKADAPPSAAEISAVQLAPKGGTPGGVMVNVTEVTARVEAIDYGARTVTLRGPEGNTRVVTVDSRVQRLNEVKPGDEVVLQVTEGLALLLEK